MHKDFIVPQPDSQNSLSVLIILFSISAAMEHAEEECGSSESGWTMYLASPMHEGAEHSLDNNCTDNDCHGDDAHNRNYVFSHKDSSDNDSNDSMASDASSGPGKHKHRGKKEDSQGMLQFKHGKQKGSKHNKYSSCKKTGIPGKKKAGNKSETKNEELMFMSKDAEATNERDACRKR